jgi:hypothetical protein
LLPPKVENIDVADQKLLGTSIGGKLSVGFLWRKNSLAANGFVAAYEFIWSMCLTGDTCSDDLDES